MSSIKGFPIEGRREDLQKTNPLIQPKFATVPPKGITRRGLDVVGGGYYDINNGTNFVVEAGSDSSTVIVTGHPFVEHDLIRVKVTANGIRETELFVERVVDSNTVILSGDFSADLVAGDEIEVLRYISPKVSPDGSSLATISSGPIRIQRGPNGVFTPTEIAKDTADISNTVPLPVEIVQATGTEINITAGDINVQTTRLGANHDSMRIGNNTLEWDFADLGGGLGAGRVTDAGAITELQSILAKIIAAPSTEAKQDTIITGLASLLAELQLKADLTETQPVSIASLPNPTGGATEAKQDDIITAVGLLTKPSDTQPISATSLPLPTGAATEATLATRASEATLATRASETTLAAMSAKLPATLGRLAAGSSLSATLATEDKAVLDAIAASVATSAQSPSVVAYHLNENSSNTISGSIGGTVMIADIGATAGKKIKVWCSFGNFLELIVNGSVVAIVPKGGFADGELSLNIPANASVALRSILPSGAGGATISAGEVVINVMG